MDIIYGYKDNAINLAVEQNEIQASGGDLIGFMSGRPLQFMNEGKVKILFQVAGKRSPELEQYGVPWVMDVIPPDRVNLFAMVNPIIDMARPYYAPPGIPAGRVRVLRAAFANMAKDAAFNEEVTRIARIRATHLGGEEMTPAIHAMLNQPPEVKEKVIGLLRSSAN
jgi:hypothetical protein